MASSPDAFHFSALPSFYVLPENDGQNMIKPVEKPTFHQVAENRYRLKSPNEHYAFLKLGGKQFPSPQELILDAQPVGVAF